MIRPLLLASLAGFALCVGCNDNDDVEQRDVRTERTYEEREAAEMQSPIVDEGDSTAYPTDRTARGRKVHVRTEHTADGDDYNTNEDRTSDMHTSQQFAPQHSSPSEPTAK